MAGRYVVMKDQSGHYHFVLKAANGETLLSSEKYASLANLENGIQSVRTNGPIDTRYERRTSSNGQPYFVLKAANHQVLGVSGPYNGEAARDAAIAALKASSIDASVIDNSL